MEFAKKIRFFVGRLPKTIALAEDIKQLVRSSGSVGANYIEANEALSKKDFLMRIKISRKEAKESEYWLQLIETPTLSSELNVERKCLLSEASQLRHIFGAILTRAQS